MASVAWRARRPVRQVVHATQHHSTTHTATSHAAPHAAAQPSAGNCEGLVAPDGTRVLPALPGGGIPAKGLAIAAATAGAAAGAAAAAYGTGVALGGASSGAGGSMGRPTTPGVANTVPAGLNALTVSGPSTTGLGPGAGIGAGAGAVTNLATTAMPDQIAVSTADTAVPIPEPGFTALFAGLAILTIALRRSRS